MGDIEVGDKWVDDNGNEYVVKDIQGTVVISESIEPIIDDEEE
ncbi:hypothetical protein JOC34_002801 [Virgibacillus halotolerans]|nr:hypothetical protein [Virgibacillus halotolerans]MBM7600410.1 hypothetical protein [Virgibacillus halotolerans]